MRVVALGLLGLSIAFSVFPLLVYLVAVPRSGGLAGTGGSGLAKDASRVEEAGAPTGERGEGQGGR